MQRPVFAANWKMNHGPTDARAFMRSFLAHYARRPDRQVIFFPPALSLPAVVDSLRERQDILVGAQNIHWEDKGAFTGEVSPGIVKELCNYVVIGHSERRTYFGETDATVNRKLHAALKHGLTPIVCVGETLTENEAGQTASVVSKQVDELCQIWWWRIRLAW